uniref:histidine kinase n=1 Tax=Chromera velia CCMP2878 TaxID=1169474 RepID=A0A0G4GLN3_9ALVE|eukprot:Cvel_22444.t1-p1 / transcript=Cvel_22444.t1 / gene=Cvel_22444 / organism=Chromera_velia_CCMP2878 / gene_product=hypothetical protein / transcript_product=hypothetical protein / location=Cvel_scaffold2205:30550-32283(-) / protein_length=578 / sequence_SO=supercontig / SO=protein_coding / is_pseudo=false
MASDPPPARLIFDFSTPTMPPSLLPSLSSQVISNFLSNARKFSASGRKITFRLQVRLLPSTPKYERGDCPHAAQLPDSCLTSTANASTWGGGKFPKSEANEEREDPLWVHFRFSVADEGAGQVRLLPSTPKYERGDCPHAAQLPDSCLTSTANASTWGGGKFPKSEANEEREDPLWVHFRFSVADEGAGVAPEDAAKLFKPYSQIRAGEQQNGGGTGLGLCISRVFVEAHCGGRIGVVSEGRGKGSEFFFEFEGPLVVEDPGGEVTIIQKGTKKETQESPGSEHEQGSVHLSDLHQEQKDEQVFLPSPVNEERKSCVVKAGESDEGLRKRMNGKTPSRRESGGPTSPHGGTDCRRSSFPLSPSLGNGMSCPSFGISFAGEHWRDKGTEKGDAVQLTAREFFEEFGLQTGKSASGSASMGASTRRLLQTNGTLRQYTADALIVDDNSMVQMAVSLALTRLGLSVQVCDNGLAAVEKFTQSNERFRIVLVDRNMPKMEGPEAISRINEHLRETEECLSTGLSTPLFIGLTGQTEGKEEFTQAGAACVLFKPVTPKILQTTLQGLGVNFGEKDPSVLGLLP